MFGDELHGGAQEVPPRQRVERGHRLVEQQELGPLRDGRGERRLRALAAGELAGALPRVEADGFDPVPGQGGSM